MPIRQAGVIKISRPRHLIAPIFVALSQSLSYNAIQFDCQAHTASPRKIDLKFICVVVSSKPTQEEWISESGVFSVYDSTDRIYTARP